jgi:hypothetical protein
VLHVVGANAWRSPDDLVFVTDPRGHPAAPGRRIVEIKTWTVCGAF